MKLEDAKPTLVELPNGLRLAALPLPHAHRIAVHAEIRIGSRFETPATNGVSHFLEHMLYRGTPTHPSARSLSLAIEELGGSLVATTSAESGSLAVTMPPESFDRSVELYADVFKNPIYSDLDVERGIVREELLEELDDKGRLVDADTLIRSLLFDGHPLGFPIAGTIDRLESFDVPMLRSHHDAFYCGRSTVITVAGPVPADQALAKLERVFAEVQPGARAVASPPADPCVRRHRFVRHASSQTALRLGFFAPGLRDPREPATELLIRVLDDGMSTRLYRRICDERGLCYDVAADYEAYTDGGIVWMAAETAHERAAEVHDELLRIAEALRDDGPTEAEVNKAKARHRWQLLELLDNPEHSAEHVSHDLSAGLGETLKDRLARIDAVSPGDVHGAARGLFRADGLGSLAVGLLPKRAREALEKRVSEF